MGGGTQHVTVYVEELRHIVVARIRIFLAKRRPDGDRFFLNERTLIGDGLRVEGKRCRFDGMGRPAGKLQALMPLMKAAILLRQALIDGARCTTHPSNCDKPLPTREKLRYASTYVITIT